MNVEKAAALLVEARRSGTSLAGLPEDCQPRSPGEAYAVQDAVAARLGAVGAWKVGAPSPEAEPGYAPIPARLVTASPARLPASAFALFGIEAEVAFRFGRALPPARRYGREEVMAAVEAVHPTIEILETRFADFHAADPLAKLADSASNGALIYGAAVADWSGVDLARPPARVLIDGKEAARVGVGNTGGDPIRLLVAVANHAAARGGLRAGDLVTTGSCTGLVFATPGAEVVAEFAGWGEVRVAFER